MVGPGSCRRSEEEVESYSLVAVGSSLQMAVGSSSQMAVGVG